MNATPSQVRAESTAGEPRAAVLAAVATRGLCKSIDTRSILRDIELTIAPGECVTILGANGAGKSTLIKLLATLTPPTTGSIEILGCCARRHPADARARLGLIAHQAMLYRDLSALENLIFFGRLYNVADPTARARQLLKVVGLLERANDPVKGFSRGMTQRVAIARALVHDPAVLLADEPFAGLDAASSAGLERLIAQLHQRGKTILLVNHDIAQSLRISTRTIILREGRIAQDRSSSELDATAALAEVNGL